MAGKPKATSPDAARYAALERAAKSTPTAFKAISDAQVKQAAAKPTQSKPGPLGLGNTKVVGGPLASGYVPLKTVSTGKFQGPMIDPNTGKSLIKPTKVAPKPVVKTQLKPTNKKTTTKTPTNNKKLTQVPTQPLPPTDEDTTGSGDISATPYSPSSPTTGTQDSGNTAKAATPDLILLKEEAFPVEVMTDLLFEDIGGTEILNFARHDLVDGIDIKYHQISNLDKIETIYGGTNLISLQNTSEQVFGKYPLKRYQYVPDKTDDPSGFNGTAYLDAEGNLIFELYNLGNSHQIEIEFQAADTNDIIY